MDDILIAGTNGQQVLCCFDDLKSALCAQGLQIAPEKVQLQDPYSTYLGFQLLGSHISTQKVELKINALRTSGNIAM